MNISKETAQQAIDLLAKAWQQGYDAGDKAGYQRAIRDLSGGEGTGEQKPKTQVGQSSCTDSPPTQNPKIGETIDTPMDRDATITNPNKEIEHVRRQTDQGRPKENDRLREAANKAGSAGRDCKAG